jgi:alkanesulfonate monooxygenase SsuD/methylene tetrahydromethanopterin reductase-like flavin-dependent oxidoreductase (luciferase family)
VGTPGEVRDDLQKFREATGYERVLLVMALPGLDTGQALRSMRLFAEHIAPVMVAV